MYYNSYDISSSYDKKGSEKLKKVAILYKNRDNNSIIEYINNTLIYIFGEYIEIVPYFANELDNNEKIVADACLVIHENMLYGIKNNISNYSKVVILKRSIRKQVLPELMAIPNNSDVFVVNDTYDTEIETIYMLCELGINSINLIPYTQVKRSGVNKAVEYVITPNELDLVPKYAKNIINIGYREIGFETLFSLMKTLDIDNDIINRNILKYSTELVEQSIHYQESYYEACLRVQLLNLVVDQSMLAVVLLDELNRVVYYNPKALSVFNLKKDEIFTGIDEGIINSEEEYKDYPIRVNDANYLVGKSNVKLVDEIIGVIITLQDERTLRDIEATIKSTIIKKGLVAKYSFNDIVYSSDSMKKCITTAKEVAATDNTVLISGESGTGKELLAQSIHNYSKRKSGPFVAVNCAAVPESLIESELFGYEGGSFTGAQKNGKIGYFEQANNGTLFLDEIGSISANFQSVLLRVIQERQVIRIGSDKVVDIDVRIIVATNSKLSEEVLKGSFRRDLYYRLNVIPITIDALNKRKEDILPLMEAFMGRIYCNLTSYEKDRLSDYKWPGNVRELENAATYYKALGRLPDYILNLNLCYDSGIIESNKLIDACCKEIGIVILKIIKKGTQPFHGIGRAGIISELSIQGINISEGKLREQLQEMQNDGYITVEHGRIGTRITQFGIEYLKTLGI